MTSLVLPGVLCLLFAAAILADPVMEDRHRSSQDSVDEAGDAVRLLVTFQDPKHVESKRHAHEQDKWVRPGSSGGLNRQYGATRNTNLQIRDYSTKEKRGGGAPPTLSPWSQFGQATQRSQLLRNARANVLADVEDQFIPVERGARAKKAVQVEQFEDTLPEADSGEAVPDARRVQRSRFGLGRPSSYQNRGFMDTIGSALSTVGGLVGRETSVEEAVLAVMRSVINLTLFEIVYDSMQIPIAHEDTGYTWLPPPQEAGRAHIAELREKAQNSMQRFLVVCANDVELGFSQDPFPVIRAAIEQAAQQLGVHDACLCARLRMETDGH